MKYSLVIALPAVGLALVVAGCSDLNNKPTGNSSAAASGSPQAVAMPETPRSHTVIFVVNPNAKGEQDPLSPRTVTLADPNSPARDAVSALLQDPNTPLPAGTALRGITIDSGLATLDFSQSPVNETGGEGKQSEALTALARTLGEFPEINQYQIEVKGQIVKAFGEFTTDGPMDVTRPVRDTKSSAQ